MYFETNVLTIFSSYRFTHDTARPRVPYCLHIFVELMERKRILNRLHKMQYKRNTGIIVICIKKYNLLFLFPQS